MGRDGGRFGPRHSSALMVRNVTEPEFGSGADEFTLQRQARAGAGVPPDRRRG